MNSKNFAAPLGGGKYKVTDGFATRLMELVRDRVIPYQWEALNDRVPDADRSGCISNFRAAAALMEKGGVSQGDPEHPEHYGYVFQDSDLYKWMEAAAFSLMWAPDEKLEQELESAVELLAAAQMPDGYLDTYYILDGRQDKRWTNLKDNHELYCAGHMIEAAVAHFRATGRRTFLDVAEKLAAHIGSVLGPEEGKLHGYPGHEEIELALVKLSEVTGKEEYLRLARYFIDQRGREPLFFEEETRRQGNSFYWKDTLGYAYYQAHKPLMEQEHPVGHAVRANYLYAGAAAAARCTGDDQLYQHLRLLWKNMTEKQMYVTGQVGSSGYGEAFSFPYNLPNDTAYAETCAGLALAFFANQMLRIERRGEYADVMERVLYNGAISGMDLEGTAFFYVNPLEVWPEACKKDPQKEGIYPVRRKWFGCACCPPNLARTLASITDYALCAAENALYQNLYLAGRISWETGGVPVTLTVEGNYPWEGELRFRPEPEQPVEFTYALRIPGWCRGRYTLKLNGEPVAEQPENGYVSLTRCWQAGDVLELSLPMEPCRIWANSQVREDVGKTAVQRGPLVYCLEEADNGPDLHLIRLPRDSAFAAEHRPDLLGGVTVLTCRGLTEEGADDALYTVEPPRAEKEKQLTWIPYYAWANRGEGEMTVWVRE